MHNKLQDLKTEKTFLHLFLTPGDFYGYLRK